MGLFSRLRRATSEARPSAPPSQGADSTTHDDVSPTGSEGAEGVEGAEGADIPADPPRPLHPVDVGLTEADREHLAATLAGLAHDGVDVNHLDALSAAYDRASQAWWALPERRRRSESSPVHRFAVGIGEYLARHTDLKWTRVSDSLGVDLGLMAARDGFAVIPANLVTARFLNRETGWIPGVVGHIVRVRSDSW